MAAKGGNFTSTGFLVSQRFSTACNFTAKKERKTGESVCSFSAAHPQGHASKWQVAGTVHLAHTDVVATLFPGVTMDTLHDGLAARWLRVFYISFGYCPCRKRHPLPMMRTQTPVPGFHLHIATEYLQHLAWHLILCWSGMLQARQGILTVLVLLSDQVQAKWRRNNAAGVG